MNESRDTSYAAAAAPISVVRGLVAGANGIEPAGLVVRAFDRDLRSEERLGESAVGERGEYEITYTPRAFGRAEHATADLLVRVFDARGELLGSSGTLFNAPPEATVNITLDDPGGRLSEYERILDTVTPLLDGAPLPELTADDVRFLAGDTRIEASHIRTLSDATRFGQEHRLPAEAGYGWGRLDYPLLLSELLGYSRGELRAALLLAIRRNIIPARLAEQLDAIVARLRELGVALDEPEPETESTPLVGRLVAERNGTPLARFTVHGVDPDALVGPGDLGVDTTDGRGYFALAAIPWPDAEERSRTVRLEIDDPAGGRVHATDLHVGREPMAHEIRVPVEPPSDEPPSPQLTEIVERFGVDLPHGLLDRLGERGLRTLTDLRRAGGLANVDDLGADPGDPGVIALEAHTSLAAISPDPEHNAKLIERGFTGVRQISTTARSTFVSASADINGDVWAARTYVAALSQSKAVDSVLAGSLADAVTTGVTKMPQSLLGEFAGTGCHCDDCQSATSPLAYLADLLDYAIDHLEHVNPGKTTLAGLTSTFHQPFAKLPTACAEMDRKVRQVRLCVEVLRGYLTAHPPSQAKAAKLSAGLHEYLVAAYTALLTGIGTSYEEIRLARTAKPEARAALAERLGIDLFPTRPDELDRLFLDVNADPPALTELALQERFGLVDTTIAQPATEPAAELRTWRLAHLRTLWRAQDRPPDQFDTEPTPTFQELELRPVVDPDLIGPDDLRRPVPGSAPFDLWLNRRAWVDERIAAIRALLGDPANLEPAFAAMYQAVNYTSQQGSVAATPWAATTQPGEFAALDEQLRDGQNVEAISERLAKDLRLGVEEFGRLMEVRAQLATGEPADSQDLSDAVDILVLAQKASFRAPWRDEEHGLNVLLEPSAFWTSLTEPQPGSWPPEFPAGIPLIDPDRDELADLPDTAADGRAVELWQERLDRLAEITDALRAERLAGDYPGMLLLALGSPSQTSAELVADLLALQQDLASPDPATVAAATDTVHTGLRLSMEDFQFLLAVHARTESSDPAAQPTAQEWTRVETVLTTAQKARTEYPVWVAAEQDPATGVTYWQARKAALPKWRAGAENRADWQRSLAGRSEPPIIDPDLIGPADLANPGSGPVYQLWKSRRDTVTGWIAAMQAEGDTLTALQAIVLSALDAPLEELSTLDEAHTAGKEVQARLDQLTLPFPAFRRIVGIAALLDQGAPLLTGEWAEVHSILAQVRKRRLATRWREDERALGVSLGPDEFRIPPVDPTVFPPPDPPELPAWRATTQALSAWRETLRSRIEQEKATITALAEVANVVEERTMPALRDALVRATNAPGASLEAKDAWLTKALLIDAKAGGCQVTTRIAQAIETMQGVLFAARTGELFEVYPDLELAGDHFDTEWETLGSYATWRGAMLVHLYPELVLAPSLKHHATPMFRTIVRENRGDGQFTAEKACAAAHRYADYLKDVSRLDVQATCEADTRITKGSACAKTDAGYRIPLHMYAIAKDSRRAYWSTYDPESDDSAYAQSFWDTIPGLEQCSSLIGAAPYRISAAERHIYLFAIITEQGVRKLVFTRFDLEGGFWDEEPTELEIPEGATQFGAVVMQVSHDNDPPLVAIRVPSGAIYWRRLDRSGSGWAQGDWRVVVGSRKGRQIPGLLALIERPGIPLLMPTRRYLFVLTGSNQIAFRVVGGGNGATDGVWQKLGHSGFRGVVAPKNDPDFAYAFSAGASTRYQPVVLLPSLSDDEWATVDGLEKWLNLRLGMSLDQIPIPDLSPFVSTRTLLGLLKAKAEDSALSGLIGTDFMNKVLRELRLATIKELQAKIDEADSNEEGDFGPWKHADELVRQVTSNEQHVGEVLAELIDHKPVSTWAYDIEHLDDAVLPGVGRLAVAGRDGSGPTANGWRSYAFQSVTGHRGPRRTAIRFADNGYSVNLNWPIAPKLSGPFEIPDRLAAADLQVRRAAIEDAWQQNAGGGFFLPPRSNLTYLEEAYYFLPVHLATQLSSRDHLAALDWLRTVYDYAAPTVDRKIYPGLRAENLIDAEDQYERRADWLLDPLNPHAIAATRKDVYTRYTILTIVNRLLDFADSEFTADTAESVPRARGLYQLALDLLGSPELAQIKPGCAETIGSLEIEIGDPDWAFAAAEFKKGLFDISERDAITETIAEVQAAVAADAPWEVRFNNAQQIIAAAKTAPAAETVGAALERKTRLANRVHAAVLSLSTVDRVARRSAAAAGRQFVNAVSFISGIPTRTLLDEPVTLPWLRERSTRAPVQALAAAGNGSTALDRWYNPTQPTQLSQLVKTADEKPWQVTDIVGMQGWTTFLPTPAPTFCVPPNPIIKAMRLRAELNLYKIRTCRNIEGMTRQLEPYAAPTDTESGLPFIGAGGQLVVPGAVRLLPTQYRYPVLVERAKQLVALAQQAESLFLNALQAEDAERYTLLRASQDLGIARAGVQLQRLRVTEAGEGTKLAELQKERAQIQVDHFTELLEEPVSDLELASLGLLQESIRLSMAASVASAIPNIIAGMATGSIIDFAGIHASIAQALSTQSTILSTMASYERRAQEWEYEKSLAEQDVKIGRQQVRMAKAHERVTAQEQTIAELQRDHAEATIDFLTTKFTGVELWSFMVRELERVYAYLLRHATAVAKLAENQLAFERQQVPPVIIQADYWTASAGSGFGEEGPDRRGLTGSARLLADLTGLDQYAFETTARKLQLTRTMSLAAHAPAEFHRFQQTGIMNFTTSLRDLDREFPGHYLRLIHRVRTTVVALTPPTQGIRATLSSAGTSRVVVAGDIFQTVTAFHGPQSIAFTSPRDATGVFELTPQPDVLAPFEGVGMETGWELRLPKAANLNLDYGTIADVLVTFEYTALNSFDYRQQVLQDLPTSFSGDRPYSFRHHLADQWFDLHNPDQTDTPMSVTFQTRREDFPTNLDQLKIQQVALYVARDEESAFEIPVTALRFTEHGTATAAGGAATTTSGVASTLKGNAGSWMSILGKKPAGTWRLTLPNTEEIRTHFTGEHIEDILFVITYTGQLPPWPA